MSSISFVEICDDRVSTHTISIENGSILFDKSISLKIINGSVTENSITFKTEDHKGSFGEHLDHQINYFYLNLMLDSKDSSILLGSKVTYGYAHDNSKIELVENMCMDLDFYNHFDTNFQTAFKTSFDFQTFMRHLSKQSSSEVSSHLQTLKEEKPFNCCKPMLPVNFDKVYNTLIIRYTESSPSLSDVLVESIFRSKNFIVVYQWLNPSVPLEFEKINSDILVIITDKEDVVIPSPKVGVVLKTEFYKTGKKCLNNLNRIRQECDALNIPDRKVLIEKQSESSCSTKSGCCQGKSDDEGCCGGYKKSSSEGGCSGCGPSGCGKDKEEVKPPAVVESGCGSSGGCCGGSCSK